MRAGRLLLPAGPRLPGATSWLIAATTLTILLAVAAALALGGVAGRLEAARAGMFHVQIVEADPERRDADAQHALARLRARGDVAGARLLDRAAVTALLRPWIGRIAEAELPLPALIEARLAPGADARAVARALAPVRSARLDLGGEVAPLATLIAGLHGLASAVAAVAAAATALVTVVATRAALAGHGRTVATLHGLGATDGQLARLVARRILVDAGIGAGAGLLLGWAALAWIGRRLAALESGFADGAAIGWGGTILLVALPIAVTALAVAVAHLTMLATLRRSP